MTAVVIDPGLFFFDVPTQQELKARLTRIRQLRSLQLNVKWINLVLPRKTPGMLARHNLYPAFAGIAQALSQHSLSSVFTAHDISYAVGQLLQAKAMEDFVCAEDVAWDDFGAVPGIFPVHANDNLDAELRRILVVMLVDAAAKGDCRQVSGLVSVFTAESLKISAILSLVDPNTLPGFMLIELPKEISREIPHIRSFEELCSILDPECLWTLADCAISAKAAIALQCRNVLKQGGQYEQWTSIPQFRVGEGFLDSLQKHRQYASMILQKSALVVLDSPNVEVNPFMTSTDANAKQVVRKDDGALAFRVHLSKSHEAMRLMYWQLPNGMKELANVGSKAELLIFEGSPARAV